MITIKALHEIKLIREACKIVAKVLLDIEKYIKAGLTTLEIDQIAEELILSMGGTPAFKGYRGYRHATCISVNSEVVHGIPSDRRLADGDIVSFDVGAIFEGYYGDGARTFRVGKISDMAENLLKCCRECLDKGIGAVRAGAHVGDISFAVESHAKANGFSVVRDLFGHGVGKALHEDPLIPNYGEKGSGPELKAGMVLAIEPMLNIGSSRIVTLPDGWTVVTADRSLSSHYENTVLVTKNGVEVLTKI